MNLALKPRWRESSTLQGIALLLPVVMTVMGSVILIPVLPQMLSAFDNVRFREYLVPSMVLVPLLCIAIFSIPAGVVVDYLGRRRVLLMSISSYAALGMLPFFLADVWLIAISRILLGIAEAVVLTASTAMIGDYFSGFSRAHWVSMQFLVANTASILFVALGGAVGNISWRVPFLLYACALPILFFVMAFGKRHELEIHKEPLIDTEISWGVTLLLGLSIMIVFGTFSTVQINMSFALNEFGINLARDRGLYAAIANCGLPLGAVFSMVALRKFRVGKLLAGEFALLTVSLLAMSQAPNYQSFISATFIGRMACGMLMPSLMTLTLHLARPTQRGRMIGLFQALAHGIAFVAPNTLIAISQWTTQGRITPAFYFFAIPAGIAAIVLLLFAMRPEQASRRLLDNHLHAS